MQTPNLVKINIMTKKLILLFLFFLLLGIDLSAQYDKDVFFWRGRQSLADGKYSQAIENFNILARLDTADFQTFFFRGIAKYNLGDLRGAKRDFDTAVRINPVFTSGYHYRGITESRFGNYDAALSDLNRALELRPGFPGIYFSRGVTYFLSQQFERAVKDFDKYIRKQAKDPSAYLNRGASYLFLGDTLKALEDYNKAIRLDRFDPEGYVRRGRLYASANNYTEAINDMNKAIQIDSSNTFAYFNRALMLYEKKDYKSAMADLNRVLRDEPGNALTLYNRGLISAQLGDFESALNDLDRVININPNNVLAHFNRASIFIELGMYRDALEDYDKAIALYPDFAKAYMNRAYVKNLLGMNKESKQDYQIARKKVAEYRAKNSITDKSLADTTQKYNALLALDAEFAKKDFNDELLQHRDVDVKLRPLYKFSLSKTRNQLGNYATSHIYENALLDKFIADSPVPIVLSNENQKLGAIEKYENLIYSMSSDDAKAEFMKALFDYNEKQFNSALSHYNKSIEMNSTMQNGGVSSKPVSVEEYYEAFYRMNRAVLRAEMIEFISSIESNVQTLSMDDSGNTRARVKDNITKEYDYSEALADMRKAAEILEDFPYIYYNMANLYTLSSDLVLAIENYSKALNLYPYLGDAYLNRGLVQIYLKEKEKGCMDLSRAGELGVSDAYGIIKRFCEDKE